MNNSILYIIVVALVVYIIIKLLPNLINYIKSLRVKNNFKRANIKDIDRMDGLDFEFYLSVLFKELGYKAVVTNGSHDFGADLILKKNNHKIVVQAKRYGYKKNVSIGAIQEVFASQRYHNADESWVITNSYFTKSAVKLAKPCDVILRDRYALVKWINSIKSETTPSLARKENTKNKKCPNCNHELKIRHSKTGNEFVGCSNYPNCKYTESL